MKNVHLVVWSLLAVGLLEAPLSVVAGGGPGGSKGDEGKEKKGLLQTIRKKSLTMLNAAFGGTKPMPYDFKHFEGYWMEVLTDITLQKETSVDIHDHGDGTFNFLGTKPQVGLLATKFDELNVSKNGDHVIVTRADDRIIITVQKHVAGSSSSVPSKEHKYAYYIVGNMDKYDERKLIIEYDDTETVDENGKVAERKIQLQYSRMCDARVTRKTVPGPSEFQQQFAAEHNVEQPATDTQTKTTMKGKGPAADAAPPLPYTPEEIVTLQKLLEGSGIWDGLLLSAGQRAQDSRSHSRRRDSNQATTTTAARSHHQPQPDIRDVFPGGAVGDIGQFNQVMAGANISQSRRSQREPAAGPAARGRSPHRRPAIATSGQTAASAPHSPTARSRSPAARSHSPAARSRSPAPRSRSPAARSHSPAARSHSPAARSRSPPPRSRTPPPPSPPKK